MASSNVLSEKDANNSLKSQAGTGANKADIKSMEYHRQVLKSKMEEEKYGYTNTISTPTSTITTTAATAATVATAVAIGACPGLGTTTDVAATAKSSLAPSSQMLIHRTRAGGLLADPNASGACSSKQQYVSPSDNIMSPCTAKLNALKGRQAGKAKPKSLFAQASAKRFVGENVFGARNADNAPSTQPSTSDQQGN
ncbi:hypothetical protein ONZ43_g2368 [Nemania bipapillata]|uniref:Uncharacterized protein n=1 Tax=Nemania bipapillata TaxID=110536 RepID=A0ACC2J0W3_9PEZI|nr:hypothetical protein ONZ43_g2368 [Nemania bipapillata]